jgi:hypothetical protein
MLKAKLCSENVQITYLYAIMIFTTTEIDKSPEEVKKVVGPFVNFLSFATLSPI